jgi:hypothetical protein
VEGADVGHLGVDQAAVGVEVERDERFGVESEVSKRFQSTAPAIEGRLING